VTRQSWDPERYARNARFVSDLGMPVVELLAPQPGERILDLGCGDGALTQKLVDMGCVVVGVDGSADQVAAARALDFRAPLRPAPATAAVRDLVRKEVPGIGPDRVVAPELAAAEALIHSGAVLAAAQAVTGPLK